MLVDLFFHLLWKENEANCGNFFSEASDNKAKCDLCQLKYSLKGGCHHQ